MSTQSQNNANRRNALKGGVKTNAGKSKSRMNANKHGALSNIVLEDERSDYDELLSTLERHYDPQNPVERFLVQRVSIRMLQSWRMDKATLEFWKGSVQPSITTDPFENILSLTEVLQERYVPKLDPESIRSFLELAQRYETAIENQIMKIDRQLTK